MINSNSKIFCFQAEALLSCNEKGVRQSKELVFLWPIDTPTPSGTAAWIKESYYSGYHHLRAPNRLFSFPLKTREKKVFRYISISEINLQL